MTTIRKLIEALQSEIEYIRDDNSDVDMKDIDTQVDNIISCVDELESNNTDAANVVSSLEDSTYFADLLADLKPAIDSNAKILY